jgi:hypothetical protein
MHPITCLLVSLLTVQPDTVVRLGTAERDLTGDGRPEILRLIGTGQTIDSLDVTFSVESAGRVVYRMQLRPLSRTVGFDNGRRSLTAAEYRTRLNEFGPWFFGEQKFMRPGQFVASLRGSAPRHVEQIPEAIARDGGFRNDVPRAEAVWQEIQTNAVTVFQFSPGGDAVTAIAWSTRDQRFYRLLECC